MGGSSSSMSERELLQRFTYRPYGDNPRYDYYECNNCNSKIFCSSEYSKIKELRNHLSLCRGKPVLEDVLSTLPLPYNTRSLQHHNVCLKCGTLFNKEEYDSLLAHTNSCVGEANTKQVLLRAIDKLRMTVLPTIKNSVDIQELIEQLQRLDLEERRNMVDFQIHPSAVRTVVSIETPSVVSIETPSVVASAPPEELPLMEASAPPENEAPPPYTE